MRRGKVDFAPFVAISGNANAAITVENEVQLCVDGLKHGERYAIVLREGVPSSVDETLLKSADYEIYVRDRSPQVRFTGKNYVLPRIGQEGIPVVSVNATKIDVTIIRIGDRNLLPTLRSDDFLSQISVLSRRPDIGPGRRQGLERLDRRKAALLNAEVTTAFPVLEAVGKLEAGVYVMTACAPTGLADDDYGSRATQWFVVSDLGLTAFSGTDGVHVLAKSLASAGAARRRRAAADRPQQRGARHQDRRTPTAMPLSIAGLVARQAAAWRRRSWWPRTERAITASSTLSSPLSISPIAA